MGSSFLAHFEQTKIGRPEQSLSSLGTKPFHLFTVALYNPSDTVCSFSVPFSSLEFGGNVKVRDLVKHNDLGSFSGTFEQTLPTHSAMFLRMEGETRLEPTLYEAEWAYLPLFNDLGKNPKGILYANDKEASGKMKVGFLGGQPENYAEWKEVYSGDGGRYNMTIHYSYGKGRQIELDKFVSCLYTTPLSAGAEKPA